MIAMIAMLAMAAAAPAAPGPEALALGREVAEAGTMAALLPVIEAKEVEEMIADHRALGDSDKAALRAVAHETYQAGRARLIAAIGRAYAETLSLADLRTLAAFDRGPAAARYRAAQPRVILGTMQALGNIDFKGEAITAFCRKTGKLCPAR